MALILRLWVIRQLLPQKAWQYFYAYNEFARIASFVVSGAGYSSPWIGTPIAPTSVEPPLYTCLLAGIFKLFGTYSYASLIVGIGLNAILSSITAVLLFRLGKRDFTPAAGLFAAWLWSAWLYEATVSVRLWESSLAALELVVALLWLPRLREDDSASHWLLFGTFAGLSALTNTTMMALFPFFWLWLIYRRRTRVRLLLISIAACLLTLVPWTLRNYIAFDRIMPLRDNFGLELWIGNHEGATEAHQYPSAFPLIDPTEYNQLGELKFMESKRASALDFIRSHPADFLRLSARRVFRFWTEPAGPWWLVVSLLAWIGLALALRQRTASVALYAVVMLVFPLIYYLTHTFPTYRHPIEPVILILAAHSLVTMARVLNSLQPQKKGLVSSATR